MRYNAFLKDYELTRDDLKVGQFYRLKKAFWVSTWDGIKVGSNILLCVKNEYINLGDAPYFLILGGIDKVKEIAPHYLENLNDDSSNENYNK